MGDPNAVVLAALAIVGTLSGAIIWVAKFSLKTISKDMREHTNAAIQQVEASKKAAEASQEVLVFMKALNGKLARATIQTVKEQRVQHQTVQQKG